MKINNLIRDNIKELTAYSSARSESIDGLLLDANENRFGSSCKSDMVDELNKYPDPNQLELRGKLSEYLNLDYKNIICGVGSDEIIDLLIRIFCESGRDEILMPDPTYGMYEVLAMINNIKTNKVSLTEEFDINVKEMLNKVNENTKMIFLCSPNNPTANLFDQAKLIEIVKFFNGIVVVDEAYIDFCESESLISEIYKYPNLVLLRTFSKAWGLAGLRCGYCIADPEIIETILKIKLPYNLNSVTQAYIIEAIENYRRKEFMVRQVLQQREYLLEELQKIKCVMKVYRSDTNYILFKVTNASKVYSHLKKNNIVVRDRSGWQITQNCLRVTVGTNDENKMLLEKLREYK